jgi:hypothetical protein
MAALVSGRPLLLRHVRSDSRTARTSSVSRARIRTARFIFAAHVAQMTRSRLFHIDATPVSSRPPEKLVPASSTIAPRDLCLLPHRRRRPAPPPCVGGRGLALLAVMDTNAGCRVSKYSGYPTGGKIWHPTHLLKMAHRRGPKKH